VYRWRAPAGTLSSKTSICSRITVALASSTASVAEHIGPAASAHPIVRRSSAAAPLQRPVQLVGKPLEPFPA